MTLADFVLARTAKREAAALAADGLNWMYDPVGNCVHDGHGMAVATHIRRPVWSSSGQHIALNDPAAVLARCAADRAIVAEHQQVTFTDVKLGLKDVPVCAKCHSVPDWIIAWEDGWTPPFIQDAWPCRTMLLLASLDAGHPDYDESWAASCSA